MEQWQSQDAKARFSELLRSAQKAPQIVTVRNIPEVIIMSKEQYDALINPMPSFVDFMRSLPLVGVDLDITREPHYHEIPSYTPSDSN